MIAISTIILACLLLYYLSFLRRVKRGLRHVQVPNPDSGHPFVSVVLACRNEEDNIAACISSLVHQSCSPDLYELIIVDDHSSDRTLMRARDAAAQHQSHRITIGSQTASPGNTGKPAAITAGVQMSRGEIILCTDADCIVPHEWIRSMAGCFRPTVAFVAGPVLEREQPTVLSGLASLEFLGLITSAAGLIGSRRPIICNGANIGYRKDAFLKIRGYGDSSSSCDDETLMQRMLKRGCGEVVFNGDAGACVVASPPITLGAFWRQRTRWASKRGHYEDNSIFMQLMGLYLFFAALVLSVGVAVLEPRFIFIVLSVLAIKALAEFSVLREGAHMLRKGIRFRHYVVAEILHVPYIALAAMVGQIGSLRWKDRKLDQ